MITCEKWKILAKLKKRKIRKKNSPNLKTKQRKLIIHCTLQLKNEKVSHGKPINALTGSIFMSSQYTYRYIMNGSHECMDDEKSRTYIFMSGKFSFAFSLLSIFFNRGRRILTIQAAITHRHRHNVYVNIIRFTYIISGSMAFARAHRI